MTSPWKNFSLDELKCPCPKCNSTGEEMDTGFMNIVERMRLEAGFPFVVTSAYRCKDHNLAVGGANASAHQLGKGMDISARGFRAYMLVKLAYKYGMTGIGVYKNHVHLDNCTADEIISRPCLWRG